MGDSGRLFEPFRALGLYSSHVPHCTRYHQKHQEHYVFLAVGKVFHTYNCSKLGITQASNALPSEISCIAADRFYVYTGCRKMVYAFQHNRQLKFTYEGHEDDVHLLLPFGDHLISVDKSSIVKIWHIESQEPYMDMEFSNGMFRITAALHPSTYLNKILFGSEQGTMQLWNIRKNKLLFEFKDPDDSSSILHLEQSPAIDVVAVGRSSGSVSLHNIKVDRTIMRFCQNDGPVIGIAFRTDIPSSMVTCTPQGRIVVWDLEEKRLVGVIQHAHATAVAGMTFLPGQPLLVTNAADNSIKVWAFDQTDGNGRLLRCREGHSAPPTKIYFHGDDNGNIISAGLDSTLRIFSAEQEENNKNLGQASMNRSMAKKAAVRLDARKLPPIVDFCVKTAREREWDNIIAFHHRTAVATTWNYCSSRMGSHKLLHDRFKGFKGTGDREKDGSQNANFYVTAVTMTECGNFCLIGHSTGDVDIFNIQSGIYRGSLIENEKHSPKSHTKPVSGLAVDFLNQIVVSAGLDKKLKFWRFKTRKLIGAIDLTSKPSMLRLQGENSLIAVALDDFSIQVYDLDTRKLARNFPGCHGSITDMAWSMDGKLLVASSMDCTIKTWELSSSSLLDCFLVDSAAVSVAFSPNSDFLVTCHIDDLGIYLWSNRAIYGKVSLNPLPLDYHPTNIVDLPGVKILDSYKETDLSAGKSSSVLQEENSEDTSIQPLDDCLVTLSSLAASRWSNLLSLDVIKERNKPQEPPTLPKSAPFFLPTVAGLNPVFDLSHEKEESRIIKCSDLKPLSEFSDSLLRQDSEQLPLDVLEKLKDMGPSAIDLEFRSLSPDGGGSLELMTAFLTFVLKMLKSNRDFELVESYLGLFLKVHTEIVASEHTLIPILNEIEKIHCNTWDALRTDIDQCLCLLNHIKSPSL